MNEGFMASRVQKIMVEGDQELIQYFDENFFYTECGHKDV